MRIKDTGPIEVNKSRFDENWDQIEWQRQDAAWRRVYGSRASERHAANSPWEGKPNE